MPPNSRQQSHHGRVDLSPRAKAAIGCSEKLWFHAASTHGVKVNMTPAFASVCLVALSASPHQLLARRQPTCPSRVPQLASGSKLPRLSPFSAGHLPAVERASVARLALAAVAPRQ